jgi:GNAT superfamily N-acetyltransferase
MTIKIERVKKLSYIELESLIQDSKLEGFAFVHRFVDEWRAETNCFNRKGEIFFIAKDNNQLVGCCGLNIDPYYLVSGLGRVRHLYVLSSKRRQGIGSQLIKEIVREAKHNFDWLNLRTNDVEASLFYLAQGFKRSYKRPESTHVLKLK